MTEWLAGNSRIINQFLAHLFTKEFVMWQLMGDEICIGQLTHLAHAMHQNYFLVLFVHLWILNQT